MVRGLLGPGVMMPAAKGSEEPPIQDPHVGEPGYPSRLEALALLVWLLSIAGFLVWLLGFGVNV